jgi:broad specificity phosphatase PhoE
MDTDWDKGHINEEENDSPFWWELMTGQVTVDIETIWEAYGETLDRTLPHVEELTETLPGKTVVTSDHGNMIGERSKPIPGREWGHPPQMYTPQLVNVPWLECDFEERKRTTSEQRAADAAEVDDEVVNERLRTLGYRE